MRAGTGNIDHLLGKKLFHQKIVFTLCSHFHLHLFFAHRGLTADLYLLCESYQENGTCRYGAQCVDAHGPEELAEWSERFEYRRMKLQRAFEKQLYGKSYTEQLLER